jgi:multidrug efflux pump subunit AcrA (membrane-fusion protein)
MKKILLLSISVLVFSCGKKTEETKVKRKNITEMVFASGTLQADEEYNLMAQTDGYISKINFKEGDQVVVGKTLAIIDNQQSEINTKTGYKLYQLAKDNSSSKAPLLQQSQSNLTAAKLKLQQDELQATRFKKLIENNSIAKVEYETVLLAVANSKAAVISLEQQYENLLTQANQQVITQNQQLKNSQIIENFNEVKALTNGKIYKQVKQIGDYVRKGDIIAILANSQKVFANLNVDESTIEKIKINQQVIVKLNVNSSIKYKAIVSEILPTFDEQSQSFIVKAFFIQPIDFDISGTQLEANILVGNKKDALIIPRNYLGYGNKVLNTNKKPIIVKTGIVSSDYVEILEGFQEGETVLREIE